MDSFILANDNKSKSLLYGFYKPGYFNVAVYFKQMLIHLFFPFFLFYSDNMRKQGFLLNFKSPDFNQNLVFNYLPTIYLLLILLSYFMTQTSGDEISVTNGALILPFFVVFSHRNMIALKYASLTDEEYSKFMFCDDDELSIRYAQQIHIFGIWSPTRPDYIIDSELASAAIECDADLKTLFFNVKSPSQNTDNEFDKWNKFLLGLESVTDDQISPDLIQQPDGSYVVSLFVFLRNVIKFSDKNNQYKLSNIITYIVLVPLVFLLFSRYYFNDNCGIKVKFSYSPWIFLFFTINFILSIWFGFININFGANTAVELLRLRDVLNLLHESIKLPHNKLQNKIAAFEHWRSNYNLFNSTSLSNFINNGDNSLSTINDEYCNRNKKRVSYQTFKNVLKDDKLEILSQVPSIDFNDANNILTWTIGRDIILSFGNRFRTRFEFFLLQLVIWITLFILGLVSYSSGLTNQKDLNELIYSPEFLQILLLFTFLLIFISFLTFIGITINFELIRHKNTIIDHLVEKSSFKSYLDSQLEIESKPEEEKSTLLSIFLNVKSCVKTLKICNTNIDSQNELHPVKVLFMNAKDPSLTISIISYSISFYIYIYSLFTRSEQN